MQYKISLTLHDYTCGTDFIIVLYNIFICVFNYPDLWINSCLQCEAGNRLSAHVTCSSLSFHDGWTWQTLSDWQLQWLFRPPPCVPGQIPGWASRVAFLSPMLSHPLPIPYPLSLSTHLSIKTSLIELSPSININPATHTHSCILHPAVSGLHPAAGQMWAERSQMLGLD